MVKDLTPEQLRQWGFPELAYLKEAEPVSVPPQVSSKDKSDSEKVDVYRAPPQSKNPLQKYKILISSLVSPLLKGSDGLIDLEKIPGGSFEEFKDFLKAQLSVDGRSFNDFGFLDESLGKSLDGITDLFAAYHRVIDGKEFEPLLKALYEERQGRPSPERRRELPLAQHRERPRAFPVMTAGLLMGFKTIPPDPAPSVENTLPLDKLVQQFIVAWVHVSGGQFVDQLIMQERGRGLIQEILRDKDSFDLDTRAEVVKAVASVGAARGVGGLNEYILNENISTGNFFNVRIWESLKQGKIVKVSESDLERATTQALEILNTADWAEQKSHTAKNKYLENSEKIRSLPGVTPHQIKAMASLREENRSKADPTSELQAKLASFWLLVADNENFAQAHFATYENRLTWLARTEEFLAQSKRVGDAPGFIKLTGEIRDFLRERIEIKNYGTLNGTTGEKVDSAIFHTVDFISGHTLGDVFKEVPFHLKGGYTEIQRYVDEVHYASGEDEKIFLTADEVKTRDPKVRKAAALLIQGLEEAKRGMWYQYNQRSEVSQAGSWLFEMQSFGLLGNKTTIRDATRELDHVIARLLNAQDGKAIQDEVTQLQDLLKKDGALLQGMKASEFDGIEHLTQLLQSVLEIAVTAIVGRGVGTAAKLAQAAQLLKGQKISQFKALYEAAKAGQFAEVYQTYQDSKKVAAMGEGLFATGNSRFTRWVAAKGAEVNWGLKMGALLPLEDHLLAKWSDRVGAGESNLISMAQDSLSTSLAMGFFTPFAMAVGKGIQGNIFRCLKQRYAGARGVFHFGWDSGVEFSEELFDASFNKKLKGQDGALTFDEVREIGIVSTAGGGAKMGTLAESFRSHRANALSLPEADPTPPNGGEDFSIPSWAVVPATANSAPADGLVFTQGGPDNLPGTAQPPSFLGESEARVRQGPSALDNKHLKKFSKVLQEARRLSSTPKEVTRDLIRVLETDYFEKAKVHGTQTTYRLKEFLLGEQGEDYKIPQGLLEWMNRQPDEALRFPEIQVPVEYFERLMKENWDEFQLLESLLAINETLIILKVFPDNFVPLTKDVKVLRLRFLPADLWVGLPEILFGSQEVSPAPQSGLSSRQELVWLAERDERPVVLSHRLQNFDNFQDNHPYPVALHDYFHILALSRFSPETRGMMRKVLRALGEMGFTIEEGDASEPVVQHLLEGISQADETLYQSLFGIMDQTFQSRPTLLDLQNRLQEAFRGDLEGSKLLSVFEAELSKPSEDNLEAAVRQLDGLQKEWIASLRAHGFKSQRYDLRKVLGTIEATAQLPEGLRRWLRENSNRILEFPETYLDQVSFDRLEHTDREFNKHLILFRDLVLQFSEALGLPEDFLFYPKEGRYYFRFLPQELLMNLHRIVHGDNAVRRQITTQTSAPGRVTLMLTRDERPFWITHEPQDVEGHKEVPGYIVAFHDGYHLNVLSEIPRDTRRALSALADVVGEMGLIFEDEQFMDRIVDGHVDKNDSVLTGLFHSLAMGPLATITNSQEFYSRLQRRLAGHPSAEAILENYRRIFADHFKILEETSEKDSVPSHRNP